MEIQGSQQKAEVQEATQQAKAAVNAARDRVKENLEELQEIQQELQSAKDARAAGKDVNVAGLEKRISDIQVSMTASVEQAGREVSQATDKAKSTVAAKTGGHPFTEDAADTGGAQHGSGASSAHPQEPEDEGGQEDEDLPTPNASQGINQGFFVRRSSSGQATPEAPDSEESADDAPVTLAASGQRPQATGAQMAAGVPKGAHKGGEAGAREEGGDVWTPNASQGINQGFLVRRSGSGEAADGDDNEDEDWDGAEPAHPDLGMSDAAGRAVGPADKAQVSTAAAKILPSPKRPQRSAQTLYVRRYNARMAAGGGDDSDEDGEDEFGQPCPCGKPHRFDQSHKGPSTQDVLASMDDANTGAAEATRSNTATLEKLAASSGAAKK